MDSKLFLLMEKDHIKNEAGSCFFCKSENIYGDEIDFGSGWMSQGIVCENCKGRYADGYTLHDVVVLEQPTDIRWLHIRAEQLEVDKVPPSTFITTVSGLIEYLQGFPGSQKLSIADGKIVLP
jgi:hypothetical protein